ncbi:hypothetical protein [uncultured Psychroserpens sp.]|uniref:hypothetical protein n=1 Tax=uncultured Psychroserpens sp. TaxID=255436 RepID=UPI00261F02F6|nr:hypothetical protein [uncultured Psychroserpens sp.]
MLKKSSKKILIDKGLKISCPSTDLNGDFVCGISKPVGIVGNELINYGIHNLVEYNDGNRIITKTDLPTLALLYESEKWRIDCSEFVPIPGAGDFQKEFPNEELAIEYVLKYFFEENEHIAQLNNYLSKKNNSG